MLFNFLIFSFSLIKELKNDWKEYLYSNLTVFTCFYSPNCEFSNNSLIEFEKASNSFHNVIFAKINCLRLPKACEIYRITSTPVYSFFLHNRTHPIEFINSRIKDEFISFVEFASKKSTSINTNPLIVFDPISILKIKENNLNVILLFRFPWCRFSKELIKLFRILSSIYESDNIKFGSINCNNFGFTCVNYDAQFIPTLHFYKNGELINILNIIPNLDEFINLINFNYSLNRLSNGLLNYSYGLTDNIKNSINLFKNNQINDALNLISDNLFLINLMNKIQKDGIEIINSYLNSINSFINNKEISINLRDQLFIKKNILNYFYLN